VDALDLLHFASIKGDLNSHFDLDKIRSSDRNGEVNFTSSA